MSVLSFQKVTFLSDLNQVMQNLQSLGRKFDAFILEDKGFLDEHDFALVAQPPTASVSPLAVRQWVSVRT